jgi:hypothetical protein
MAARVALVVLSCLLAACSTPSDFGGLDREVAMRMVAEREREIAAEPRGDYFIGRRYFLPQTRFWGYLRQPGQSWRTAQLVIIDESQVRVPDRLPEAGDDPAWGYDHNREYVVRGRYTGRTAYDPNSNQRLPEFRLTGIELRDANPGFLFKPGERYQPGKLPVPE